MHASKYLRDPLPSVFAADLRTALNEAVSDPDLRKCADMLNSLAFEQLPHDEQVELAALYSHKYLKITGALLG